MNYLRTLIKCECIKCHYQGHDIDFENLVSGEPIKGETPTLDSEPNIYSITENSDGEYQIMYQYNICPNCKEKDTMKKY